MPHKTEPLKSSIHIESDDYRIWQIEELSVSKGV